MTTTKRFPNSLAIITVPLLFCIFSIFINNMTRETIEGKSIMEVSPFVSETVETLSSKLLPHINFNELKHSQSNIGYQMMSSLPYQMVLYFSALYFPAWLFTTGAILYVKFWYLDIIYRYVLVAIYIAIVPLEVARLYLGYSGNINEKVPEIAGSWLIVLLLQLPLVLFILCVPGCLPSPLDCPLQGLFVLLLMMHLYTGRNAATKMAAQQARMYRLQALMSN